MFFLSKNVTDRIRSLGQTAEVQEQVDAIKDIPGFEVYANAIAEGVRENLNAPEHSDGRKSARQTADAKKIADR